MGLTVDKRDDKDCASSRSPPFTCMRPANQATLKPVVFNASGPWNAKVLKGVPKPLSNCAGHTDDVSDTLRVAPPHCGRSCQAQGCAMQQGAVSRNCRMEIKRPCGSSGR